MTSTDEQRPERDSRQRDLVPPDRLSRCHAVVVGVGSVGRQVALQLAATGVPAMTLYDPDVVGVENLAPQGFWETDVGDPKVDAVANVCHQVLPRMELHARRERFRKSAVGRWPRGRDHVLFCCVDSIAARQLVWAAVRGAVGFYADGRMAGEVVRVLASGRPATDATYSATLFAPAEAFAGSCTAKSTMYAGSVAAGLMVGQLSRWLRGLPVVADQTFNLLAAELSVADPDPE